MACQSEYLGLTLPQHNPLRIFKHALKRRLPQEEAQLRFIKGEGVRTVSPHTQGTHLTTMHAMHFQFTFFSPPELLDCNKKNHLRTDARSTQPPLLSDSTTVITVYHISYFSSNNEFYGLFVSELLSLNYCDLTIVIKHCCT